MKADDARWEQVMENMDLLFARVGDISSKQLLADQQMLSKQIDATGQDVAKLTMKQPSVFEERPPSPAASEAPAPRTFHRHNHDSGEPSVVRRSGFTSNRHQHEVFDSSRTAIPKLSCPRFEGANPRIWKDKCIDYFKLCNIPESMWPLVASLHMDGVASCWLQVYKLKGGLGNWQQFMSAVENKFGANDYRAALGELLELRQTSSVEDYVLAFEQLQYQLTMHNMGLDDMFFVTQFIRGLLSEIGAGVQAQIPDTMDRAVLLAKIQQQLWEKGKGKGQKSFVPAKQMGNSAKSEAKGSATTNTLWKERQIRNYRRDNNLCFYCGEAYSPAHAVECAKRPKPQVNALALNSLDMPLSEEGSIGSRRCFG